MNSITVLGGNGFLGRKICEVGIRLGWHVTSLSRSGNPPSPTTYSDSLWISKVKWELADLMDPESYKKFLKNQTAVVHLVGILFENQGYKQMVNLNFNFLNDIQKLGNMLKGSNPMEKELQTTYEAIQRDSAVILADTFMQETTEDPTFVYISAEMKPPLVPERYLTTKREAEFELRCKKGLRSILVRPGIMYDEAEPLTNNRKLFSKFLDAGYGIKNGVFGENLDVLNKLVRPSVLTEKVALKIFEKLQDKQFEGVVPLDELAK